VLLILPFFGFSSPFIDRKGYIKCWHLVYISPYQSVHQQFFLILLGQEAAMPAYFT